MIRNNNIQNNNIKIISDSVKYLTPFIHDFLKDNKTLAWVKNLTLKNLLSFRK